MEYIKLVRGSPTDTVWWALTCRQTLYAVGEISIARCAFGDHEVPDPDCQCGIYATRASLYGLLLLDRFGWMPNGSKPYTIIAVRPIGKAYDDGVTVRSERVLTLGPFDWRSVLPPALRRLDDDSLAMVLHTLANAHAKKWWSAVSLSTLRHLCGHGCYSAERMARILAIYRHQPRLTECPFCGKPIERGSDP